MILSLHNTDNYTYKYNTQIINNKTQIITHTEKYPFITQTITYIYKYNTQNIQTCLWDCIDLITCQTAQNQRSPTDPLHQPDPQDCKHKVHPCRHRSQPNSHAGVTNTCHLDDSSTVIPGQWWKQDCKIYT